MNHFTLMFAAGLFIAGSLDSSALAAPRAEGQLRLEVVDSETGESVGARIHLKNSRGRAVKLSVPGTAEFGGHFYIDGRIELPLRRGQYTFELDAGPDYRPQTGHFEIERHADDTKRIEVRRFASLAEEGWWGGDLDVHRRTADLPLIMRAEGLHVVPQHASARPPDEPFSRVNDCTIARVPYAWNLPVWLARGELDAIQLIHHHALRDGVLDHEDDGRPRDRILFPGRAGNGRWSETVYYHVLNCGLRIPPAAGSGSGFNDNPVGTNRVYAFCGADFSEERWWDALRAGRVFVTNGPLLRAHVDGHPPGYIFHLAEDDSLTLEIGLDLATRLPIEYLQIINNGAVDAEVRLDEWKNRRGRLPPVVFHDSGWFLVRAVTTNPNVYQLASSGPYYVERSHRPRISRRSVQFFLDWIAASKTRSNEMTSLDDAERETMLAEQQLAHDFFSELLTRANAD